MNIIRLFIIFSFISIYSQLTLDELMDSVNTIIIKFSKEIENKYYQRCDNCTSCSIPACSFINYNLKCLTDKPLNQCTECIGSLGNQEKSIFHMSNIHTSNEDNKFNLLNDIVTQNTICYTALLDDFFIKSIKKASYIELLYFSSSNGIQRRYPGGLVCSPYDHKLRPFWTGTISGSKNIILLLEITKLYESNIEFEIMQRMANLIIEGSTFSDSICLVIYNNSQDKLESVKIIQDCYDGLDSLKTKLKEYINNLNYDSLSSPNAMVDYINLFNKLFDFVIMSDYTGNFISSDVFIIHIYSGFNPISFQSEQSILDHYHLLKERFPFKSKRFIMFNYIIGKNSSKSLFDSISCDNNGASERLFTVDQIESKINVFYLSLMMNNINNFVTWSAPYESASGAGQITTASIPIFIYDSNHLVFLGVASADVKISTIDVYYYNNIAFIERVLKSKSRQNPSKMSTNKCQSDKIRTVQCTPIKERPFCDSSVLYLDTYPICPHSSISDFLCDLNDSNGNLIKSNKNNFSLSDLNSKSPCCVKCNNTSLISIIILLIIVILILTIIGLITHRKINK